MTSPLLVEAKGVVALPFCTFCLHGRDTEGLIWDLHRGMPLRATLPGIWRQPTASDIALKTADPERLAKQAEHESSRIEEAAIFGGYLIRHFGHFCHESLSRLWWLGQGDQRNSMTTDLCRSLQDQALNVYFFMPAWLDDGKDLLPYMKEILEGLGLEAKRIRIITNPVLFSRLLVPSQAWGYNFDHKDLDRQLGCDSKALMRSLFAGFRLQPSAGIARLDRKAASARKIYVSRSGLPINMGRPLGDAWLDELMHRAGYDVFRPEQHSIQEQIASYSAANHLVFVDGSALYPLWFTKLRSGARISIILRRRQGAWTCEKVRSLMTTPHGFRWRIVDRIIGEELTSENDWESHNLVDFRAIARDLLGTQSLHPSAQAQEALAKDLQALVAQLGAGELASILQLLINRTVLGETRTRPNLFRRVRQRVRQRVGRWLAIRPWNR